MALPGEIMDTKITGRADDGLSLTLAECGCLYRLQLTGNDRKILKNLRTLGLPQGCDIQVLQHQPGGGVVVSRGNLRVALGPSIAAALMVLPVRGLAAA